MTDTTPRRFTVVRPRCLLLAAALLAVYGPQFWKSYQTYRLRSEIARLGGDLYASDLSGIESLFQSLVRPRAEVEVSVFLRDTDVDDQWIRNHTALEYFHNLTLVLAGTQVTDQGLKYLETLPNLKGLNIEGTRVSDRGLVHSSGLPHLKLLCLGKTQVTDAGLKQLRSLPELRVLYVRNTQTGDAGLELPELAETGVTEAAVNKLEKALPKQKVYFPP